MFNYENDETKLVFSIIFGVFVLIISIVLIVNIGDTIRVNNGLQQCVDIRSDSNVIWQKTCQKITIE